MILPRKHLALCVLAFGLAGCAMERPLPPRDMLPDDAAPTMEAAIAIAKSTCMALSPEDADTFRTFPWQAVLTQNKRHWVARVGFAREYFTVVVDVRTGYSDTCVETIVD